LSGTIQPKKEPMKTEKMDVFKAIETLTQQLSKLIGIKQIDLTFQVYDNKRVIRVTVFHELENIGSGNFSVCLYSDFGDIFSMQSIIHLCKAEICKIKPTAETQFEAGL